jgi:hypothetical protein
MPVDALFRYVILARVGNRFSIYSRSILAGITMTGESLMLINLTNELGGINPPKAFKSPQPLVKSERLVGAKEAVRPKEEEKG